jgi:hypothetical protein
VQGRASLALLLLEHGAKVTDRTLKGNSALHLACQVGLLTIYLPISLSDYQFTGQSMYLSMHLIYPSISLPVERCISFSLEVPYRSYLPDIVCVFRAGTMTWRACCCNTGRA